MYLRELEQVGAVLQLDQALHDDVDGVPAEGGEGAGRVGRHDGLDAGRDLGRLLPVEREVESHAALGEGRMELEEGVGLAVVLARALHDALEAPAVLGVDEDDDVAAANGLGQETAEGNALAGLRGADEQRSAFEVLQRAVERFLVGSTPWMYGRPISASG